MSKPQMDGRVVGALICYAAGLYLFLQGLERGGWWRFLFGVAFGVFGAVRGFSLIYKHPH